MSKKDLKYYQSLDYQIIVETEHFDDEQWFIAYTKALGKFSCYGRGETPAEAIESFYNERDEFIAYLYREGKSIPEPEQTPGFQFSGIFNVRTSPVIHATLVQQAKELGISLNLYINQIIAAAAEKKQLESQLFTKLTELGNQIDKHHYEITKKLGYDKEVLDYNINKEEGNVEYSFEGLQIAS